MKEELLKRLKKFALNVIDFCEKLPQSEVCRVIGKQLLRSGTSVYANYRAACKARTKPDFINKIGIVEEEADESCCWIELLIESGKITEKEAERLLSEAKQLTAIMAASARTAKNSLRMQKLEGGKSIERK